jgi:predicted component of type VI protein secretion system
MSFLLSLRQGHAQSGAPAWMVLTGTDCVVGADPACDWRLSGVAARHCQFGWRGGRWLVVDLGGGTSVNGTRLDAPRAIAAGDQVTAGACTIAIEDEQAGYPAVGGLASDSVGAFLAAAGLSRTAVPGDDAAIMAAAGTLVQGLVAGLVAQLSERARAKAELGAAATEFQFGATNPLKTLPPAPALAALLASAPGTMQVQRAVADAFGDVEAHHAATLAGMQEALAVVLTRFSPAAFRGRAQDRGLIARVLPGAKDAALWQAYEREFDGEAKGSSDAFVEAFARGFAAAYAKDVAGIRP